MHNVTDSMEQDIQVPLPVGSRVVLYEDAEIERVNGNDVGGVTSILFEGYVNRYVPDTGLLEFEDSDVGRADFLDLLQECDGIEVIYDG